MAKGVTFILMKKKVIVIICLIFALMGAIKSYQITSSSSRPVESKSSDTTYTKASSIADRISLESLEGKKIALADFQDHIIILNFWATWCPPCVAEIPHLVDIQKNYANKKVQVIGVTVDRDKRPVKPFAKQKNINYPILFSNSDIEKAYGGISSIPTTIILDRDHNMVDRIVGYHSYEQFKALITPHL